MRPTHLNKKWLRLCNSRYSRKNLHVQLYICMRGNKCVFCVLNSRALPSGPDCWLLIMVVWFHLFGFSTSYWRIKVTVITCNSLAQTDFALLGGFGVNIMTQVCPYLWALLLPPPLLTRQFVAVWAGEGCIHKHFFFKSNGSWGEGMRPYWRTVCVGYGQTCKTGSRQTSIFGNKRKSLK